MTWRLPSLPARYLQNRGLVRLEHGGGILVTGAGGFIGGHLVGALLERGYDQVRGVDIKPLGQWQQVWPGAHNVQADLRMADAAARSVADCRYVINLACDMGGMGYIENNKTSCMLSVLINTHLLQAAHVNDIEMYFFASSACVYPAGRQSVPDVTALRESDVYPAMPEDGYGWEKLFGERLCRHFLEEFGVATRVARYHNVYGTFGTWEGGREKAPAAVCRKVAEAVLHGTREIEIWGDGQQTRSFTYIDDCITGTMLLAESDYPDPVNIGSAELVSVNQLVDLVEDIAGIALTRKYLLDAPTGVRGRNSDNSLIRELFGWEPTTKLADGLEVTYRWIYDQVARQAAGR